MLLATKVRSTRSLNISHDWSARPEEVRSSSDFNVQLAVKIDEAMAGTGNIYVSVLDWEFAQFSPFRADDSGWLVDDIPFMLFSYVNRDFRPQVIYITRVETPLFGKIRGKMGDAYVDLKIANLFIELTSFVT